MLRNASLATGMTVRYTLWGVGFGLLFPLVATIVDSIIRFETLSLDTMLLVQADQPLHWIIDTAPLVLGVVFYFIGLRTEKLIAAIEAEKLYAHATAQADAENLAKSVFLSNISHEIRTPLTAINGSISLLLANAVGEIPERLAPLLEMADRNCERVISLVDEVLDLEKIKSGKMYFNFKKQPLLPILEQAIELNSGYGDKFNVSFIFKEPSAVEPSAVEPSAVEPSAIEPSAIEPSAIELSSKGSSSKGSSSDALVNVDEKRIVQVLTNLLSNSAKFSAESGVVEVSIVNSDKRVRVYVTDYGKGIPFSFRENIFQPFMQADTTDSRAQGTGLGLNICKRIIEAHDGSISFTSELGIKTEFFFDLPVVEA